MGNTQSKMYKIYIITIVLVGMLSIIPIIQSQASVRVAATVWSPDGNRIAIAEQGTGGVLRIWDVSGTIPVVQISIPNVFAQYIYWKSNTKRIITSSPNGIQIWNTDINDPVYSLGQLVHTLNDAEAVHAAWSFDGSKIITQNGKFARNRVWNTINDQYTLIEESKGPYDGIKWHPSRNAYLLLNNAAGVVVDSSLSSTIVLKYNIQSEGFLSGAWNPDGTKVIVSGEDGTFVFEPFISPNNPMWHIDQYFSELAWSGDGQRIAGIIPYPGSQKVVVFRADNGIPLIEYSVSDIGDTLSWNLNGTKLIYPAPINGVTLPPIVTPPQPAAMSVTSLNLINADTDTSIQTLTSGNTLNLGSLPTRNLNIRADASGSPAKVIFTLNGVPFREDTSAPFSFGDTSGNYAGWTPDVGSYTLTATPYNASNTPGTPLTVNFTVTNCPR